MQGGNSPWRWVILAAGAGPGLPRQTDLGGCYIFIHLSFYLCPYLHHSGDDAVGPWRLLVAALVAAELLECCCLVFSIAEMFSLQRMCILQPFLNVLSASCSQNPSYSPRSSCTVAVSWISTAHRGVPAVPTSSPSVQHFPTPLTYGIIGDSPSTLWLCVVEVSAVSAVSQLLGTRPGMDVCVTEQVCATPGICAEGNIPSPVKNS